MQQAVAAAAAEGAAGGGMHTRLVGGSTLGASQAACQHHAGAVTWCVVAVAPAGGPAGGAAGGGMHGWSWIEAWQMQLPIEHSWIGHLPVAPAAG